VEGRIDLLFEEHDSLVLVDYKTDAVAKKDLPDRTEHYRRQGELYAEAVAAICGKPVKEVVFLFAAIPEEVSLSVTSLK
jgi:ATP-dependent helicase/nuclease subunit A